MATTACLGPLHILLKSHIHRRPNATLPPTNCLRSSHQNNFCVLLVSGETEKILFLKEIGKKCKKCLESCHQDYEVFFRSKLGPNYLMLVYLSKFGFTSISI
jgi:hypothetical protein